MGQEDIWRAYIVSKIPGNCRINSPESEICPETGSLQDLQGIIESNGLGVGMECDRKETAISSIGGTETVVKRPGGAIFGVVDLFHCNVVNGDLSLE